MMIFKQPAMGSAILWGDGVLQGDSVVAGESLIWDCNVGTAGILEAVSGAWTSAFIDPASIAISDESILVYGETGALTGMKMATPDSVYYPAIQ